MSATDPQTGDFWSTPKGRTVEILARELFDGWVDVIAYRFLGGSMIYLRSVADLQGWIRAEVFE